jgi:hypothetical protein
MVYREQLFPFHSSGSGLGLNPVERLNLPSTAGDQLSGRNQQITALPELKLLLECSTAVTGSGMRGRWRLTNLRGDDMKKSLPALAAAAVIAATTVALPTSADAQWRRGWGWGGGAFLGGLAAGAIIGGALASPYYGYPYGYGYYPAYYGGYYPYSYGGYYPYRYRVVRRYHRYRYY